MKRSQVNKIIEQSIAFVENQGYILPPFAKWSVEDWKTKDIEYQHILLNKLGWDVADYGFGEFKKCGIVALTIRIGIEKIFGIEKPYAEKLLILEPFQEVPMHFHPGKIEDLINRGGSDLFIQLYDSNADNTLSDENVKVFMDGRIFTIRAGEVLTIKPGESITLMPRQYHKMWTEKSKILLGEVTMTNNDHFFYNINPSSTEIEEDETPKYFLANDTITLTQ